jgi:hypothetical protein
MARQKKTADETKTQPEVLVATGTDENGNPTITWERPSGFTLTTVFNDDTVAYAMENGWTPLPT